MDSSREIEFEARLVRIEQAIAILQRSVDAILSGHGASATASAESSFRDERRDPLADQVFSGSRPGLAGGPAEDRTRYHGDASSWFSPVPRMVAEAGSASVRDLAVLML